jgi:hypothetical protein
MLVTDGSSECFTNEKGASGKEEGKHCLARRLANRKVHSEENQFGICAKAESALDTQICIPIIQTFIVSA